MKQIQSVQSNYNFYQYIIWKEEAVINRPNNVPNNRQITFWELFWPLLQDSYP